MNTTLADTWFSRFIRLRDSDNNGIGRCSTCGRIGHVKTMDNGHYIKRQHQAVRFSEVNCNLQCKHCNNFEQGNDVKFREYLVKKHGEKNVLLLEASKRTTTKRSANDIKLIAAYYKKENEKLLKEKGIVKWW